jgi:Cytochrome c554 and c-prime
MLSSSVILAPKRALADDAAKANYVGVEVCAGCHQTQAERWKTSHHALAMEKATLETVLGNFSGVSVENFGVVSTFSRVGDKFMVRTDGPDGVLRDYEITHTFGIDPLQQYLIGFPDGRYSGSPGIRARRTRVASAGFTSTPTKSSNQGHCCTGPAATKHGITSAPTATPRT